MAENIDQAAVGQFTPKGASGMWIIIALAIVVLMLLFIAYFLVKENSTIRISEAQLARGQSVSIPQGRSADFTLMNRSHTLTVNSANETEATTTIQSIPIVVILQIGEGQNISLNGNGVYDLSIMFNGIDNGVPRFALTEISQPLNISSSRSENNSEPNPFESLALACNGYAQISSESDYCISRSINVDGAIESVNCADPRVEQLMDSDKRNAYACGNAPGNGNNSDVLPGTSSLEAFDIGCNTYAKDSLWTEYNTFRNITINGSAILINCADPMACIENWSCTDWSACISNNQTRGCTDLNGCATTVNEPIEVNSCQSNPNNEENNSAGRYGFTVTSLSCQNTSVIADVRLDNGTDGLSLTFAFENNYGVSVVAGNQAAPNVGQTQEYVLSYPNGSGQYATNTNTVQSVFIALMPNNSSLQTLASQKADC